MRRFLLPLVLLGLLTMPSGASAYKIGISDQNGGTFVNPLFKPLKTTMARYVAPWDVMTSKNYLPPMRTWIANAQAAGQQVLIAFEASRKPGKERIAPSVRAYTRAIKKFKRAFPTVRNIQAWNEANRCQYRNEFGFVLGQPICKKPKRAAQYYMAARKVFKAPAKVTGLDILDGAKIDCSKIYCALRYIKAFLRHAKPHPKYWGFHNYSDTNRFSTKRTRALLKATKRGEVWLTETGGIVSLGRSFPYNPRRAAKALGCMFTLAKTSRRITRLYVYNFVGLKRGRIFDAGLINANGTKRPGYRVVKTRKARPCRR